MENSTPVNCPMQNTTFLKKLEVDEPQTNSPYLQAVGSIMYAMVATRPDLTFVIQDLSQFMSNPGNGHWKAIKTTL